MPRAILASIAALLLAVAARVRLPEEPGGLPAAPDIALVPLASGIGPITAIANAGDARLFLTVQTGEVLIFSGGQVQPAAFLDLSPLVSCCGERGLLGLAFHPHYAANRFLFVDYTDAAGNTVIARYQAFAGNADQADPASGVVLLTIPQPFSNHNGGQLQFGPDGDLYIGTGDGGSANDPMCNGQRQDTLLGKLLRIDVDQNAGTAPFFGIPPSNPFAAAGPPADRIWALGLRNPWRFSFDRATGDLFVADVGQSAREEIDFQPRASAGGENYGWKIMEGTLCGAGGSSGCPAGLPACHSPTFKAPLYEYGHEGSGGCTGTVIGGYVYRGAAYPALDGVYFYGDYCFGRLFGNGQVLTPAAPQLTTFGEDAAGEIYLGTEDGRLSRIASAVVATPTPIPPRLSPDRSLPPRPPPRVLTRPPD